MYAKMNLKVCHKKLSATSNLEGYFENVQSLTTILKTVKIPSKEKETENEKLFHNYIYFV